MNIIALDPGYDRLGVAVLEINNGNETLLYSACITTSRDDTFETRLLSAADQFKELCEKYEPREVAIESVFFTKNQKTAMNVSRMIGALILEAKRNRLGVFEYSPPEIKQAVTGNGASSKDEVMRIVPMLVALDHTPTLDDEWDAISVGLAHAAIRKSRIIEGL